MRRVFKTRSFSRWAKKARLADGVLCAAVQEMADGLFDADLGGGIIKKRVAIAGRGKRGGARTLVATNKESTWFFVFGFEKNEREAIEHGELVALRDIAKVLLASSGAELDVAIQAGSLQEICSGSENTGEEPNP